MTDLLCLYEGVGTKSVPEGCGSWVHLEIYLLAS